jgi:hypothetical protein
MVRTRRMRVPRMGNPDEWGAFGLLLALEGQNFRESSKGEVRRKRVLRSSAY